MRGITRKLIFSICYLLFFLVLFEVVSRAYWGSRRDVPFFSPVTYFYYPELRDIERIPINKTDRCFDILLLGGSVFHKNWGNISQVLLEKITYSTGKKIRVHNLSQPGHTSLDSLYKYRHLSSKTFDLIIIYHGINEVRLNNCPSSVYKIDYSHYTWYRVINGFEKNQKSGHFASSYYACYLYVRAHEKLWEKLNFPPAYIPRKMPRKEWVKYGNEIKSAKSFERNLIEILDIARQKGEPVLLMTFSFYVPEDYSFEKFETKSLDYCLFDSPIEIWGSPRNVVAGIRAHNKVLKSISERWRGTMFVDQNALIPKNRLYFNDICHLTHKGCERFVDNIKDKIIQLVPSGS